MEQISYKIDGFEGPLDLLLYLINKHKLNINDIPIFSLVEQYIDYIRQVPKEDLEQASEFLEMAARLVHIKTVSLLPVYEEAQTLKKELTAELLEYRECKKLATALSEQAVGFGTFARLPMEMPMDMTYRRIHDASELRDAYLRAAGNRIRRLPPPMDAFRMIVEKKIVSVSIKIKSVVRRIAKKGKHTLSSLLEDAESRSDMVATFLAILELTKRKNIFLEDDENGQLSVTLLSEPEGEIDFE